MVSIKDIAKACGVSAATVSKALHDQKDVGKATKERIKRTAEEMGIFLTQQPGRLRRTGPTTLESSIRMRQQWDLRMSILQEF